MNLPMPVVLIVLTLAVLAVVVLWKLLLIGGGILTAQWLMFTAADSPAMQLAVLAVPALVVAAVITHRTPAYRHRPVPAGFGSRSRAAEEVTR